MDKGKVVLRHEGGSHYYGVVLSSTIGEDNWKNYTIRWITNKVPPTETEVCRQDEVSLVEPITEFIEIQKAMTLSSAIKSPNFAKVLKSEGFLESLHENE